MGHPVFSLCPLFVFLAASFAVKFHAKDVKGFAKDAKRKLMDQTDLRKIFFIFPLSIQMSLIKTILFSGIIVFIGNINRASGANPVSVKNFTNKTDWNFVENKGQLADLQGNLLSDIKYYGHNGGANVYCKPGKISFVFTRSGDQNNAVSEATGVEIGSPFGEGSMPSRKERRTFSERETEREREGETGTERETETETETEKNRTTSRIDLILLNSNPSALIIASEKQEYYENFYLAHTPEEGITNVHTCKTITYKNIYPNIDLVLHSKPKGMKYEFVVYPGGNVNDIRLQWKGLQEIKRSVNAGMEYYCSIGKIEEDKPVSYQGQHLVATDFEKTANSICFRVGKYNKSKTLVIDPFLSWGTYFGGGDYESGNSIAADDSGNVYISGYAESQSGIATNGAFQTSFGGGSEDAFLAKFNSNGALLWATYYGGTGNDFVDHVAIDGSGNVYIAGETSSASGIATSGAYQTIYSGSTGFIAKFTMYGVRIWGTYFGSSAPFYLAIAADAFGNIYVSGTSASINGIATSGAYQTSNAGNFNAFLAKFNSSGNNIWATYFGGKGYVYGRSLCIDILGNIYITGDGNSESGIATNGAYRTSITGDAAFLAKFNSNGNRLWATYYGSYSTSGYCVITDKYGEVYISGNTTDTMDIATKGAYQTSLNQYNVNVYFSDAFIAKFNGSGAIQWATYYGGTGEDFSEGIVSDNSGNIYITGATESTSDIATTGSYQTSFGNGNEHAFIAQFNNSGSRLWASYYGGNENDVGNGVASDGSGNIYITGNTKSSSGISTSGAFQTSLAGPQNAFLAQFNFKANNDAGIISIFNSDSNLCAGMQLIKVQLHNYGNTNLDSANIGWTLNGKNKTPVHWSGQLAPGKTTNVIIGNVAFSPGKDTITAWTSKPNGVKDSVPANDSSAIILNILTLPTAYTGPPATICEYDVKILGAQSGVGGNTYSWTSNPSGFTSTSFFVDVDPDVTTTYYFTETNNKTGCSKTDSVVITVNPAPPANTGPAETICFGDSIKIGDISSKGFSYSWVSTPSGFSSTVSNPVIKPTSTTSYTLTQKNLTTGCSNTNKVKITVNPLPVANVGQGSYAICNGTHIKIGANALPAIDYLWSSSPAGFISTVSNPVVDPGIYTQYFLTVRDTLTGCVNKNFANVTVSILKAPVINVGKNQAICIGESAQIGSTALAGDTYVWTSNPVGYTTTKANPVVTPLKTTSYSLTVTSAQGCTNFDSVTVTVNPRPIPVAGIPRNICSGSVVKLGEPKDSGHIYAWYSKPKGFSSGLNDPVDSPEISTEYYLKEIISATGCADSDSVKITVVPRPHATFDTKNINGFEYQFSVINPNYANWQYQWNFGDTTNLKTDTIDGHKVTHTYTLNGSYPVVLTVSLPGFCTVIDSERIGIKESASFDIFPNPFVLQTDIKYVLLSGAHVNITMTDEIGRNIGTLVDKQLAPGEYNTIYDGGAWKTRPGMYFIIFRLDDQVTVKKILQIDSIYY